MTKRKKIMAAKKKTLGIAASTEEYNSFIKALEKHNEILSDDEKLTLSQFLRNIIMIGVKMYKNCDCDFKKTNKII